MKFKRLKLNSFKSFVDPVEFEIQDGLTGIVGPNGCGKSNVVEAFRWVMGESSAKQMRGEDMDDVIFGGSSNRPPRDIAEATVVIDNSEMKRVSQFSEYDELEVKCNNIETAYDVIEDGKLFADPSNEPKTLELVEFPRTKKKKKL